MKYSFQSVLGTLVIEGKALVDGQAQNELPKDQWPLALELSKDHKNHSIFIHENLKLTKHAIKDSVNEDNLIIQTISNIHEIDRACNMLSKRAREWYGLYCPEFTESLGKHEKFIELITTRSREELMEEIKLEWTMGADLESFHVDQIILLAEQINNLYQLREKHLLYLEKIMKKYCPNILELAGPTIGAGLIELAKGLKRLAMLPASTVQLLGAEKALFRHLKTGSKSPKYGIIINHPIIQGASRTNKGKSARALADKLSLCARLDFFKGEFKAAEYKKDLEEKFNERRS